MLSLSLSVQSMSKEVEPSQVMGFLNDLFSKLDELVEVHKVYKVGMQHVLRLILPNAVICLLV